MLEYKLTFTWANGQIETTWHNKEAMQDELIKLSSLLGSLSPGESFTIERLVPNA